jgi:hypothetical protein
MRTSSVMTLPVTATVASVQVETGAAAGVKRGGTSSRCMRLSLPTACRMLGHWSCVMVLSHLCLWPNHMHAARCASPFTIWQPAGVNVYVMQHAILGGEWVTVSVTASRAYDIDSNDSSLSDDCTA